LHKIKANLLYVDGGVDALNLQPLSPSNGLNSPEPPNSSASHLEPDSSATDRNTTLGLSGERNGSNLNEQGEGERENDSSNISIRTPRSMGHSSHTPFPVQGHDDMLIESKACTSLEPSKDASNLHMTGGSNAPDSIDLERSPIIGIETSSTPAQDTARSEDYSNHQHDEDRILTQRRHATAPSSLTEHQESGRIPAEADSQVVENLFHAFPETRLFRSVTFATVCFLIMTLMVLGNLIYTYRPLMLHNMFTDWSVELWRLRKVHLRLMDRVTFGFSYKYLDCRCLCIIGYI
jgi:hypothetical protein